MSNIESVKEAFPRSIVIRKQKHEFKHQDITWTPVTEVAKGREMTIKQQSLMLLYFCFHVIFKVIDDQ